MTQRWLAASPFVFVALTAAVFALAPAGARELVVQGEIDLSKLLALAGLNMVVFHATTHRSVEVWGRQPRTPRAAKICGGISLGLWIGVVTLGRWIGFV